MKSFSNHVKNPLTAIVTFSAITEVAASAALPFLEDGNQTLAIWLVLCFPFFLVLLFFLTLNFNHKVLYAPSDFENEENFFRNLKQEKTNEDIITKKKIKSSETSRKAKKLDGENQLWGLGERALKALALQKINKIFQGQIKHEVKISNFLYDSAILSSGEIIIAEVKVIKDLQALNNFKKQTIPKILNSLEPLANSDLNLRFALVVITDLQLDYNKDILSISEEFMSIGFMHKNIYIYDRNQLLHS